MDHKKERLQWIPEVSLSPWMERLLPYRGQYVAVLPEDRLIANPRLTEVLREAKASGQPFALYVVPEELGKLRMLTIRIREVVR